jgi:hypothetical protein
MKQRRLPFIKLTSKIVRFPKAEVDAYLVRNFRVSDSPPSSTAPSKENHEETEGNRR